MKKYTPLIIAGICTAAVLCAVWHAGSGISVFAKKDWGDSSTNSHSQEEIRQAAACVYDRFSEYQGCVMLSLTYDDAASLEDPNRLIGCPVYVPEGQQPTGEKYDDVIIFDSSFTSSSLLSDPGFAGYTQKHWGWMVAHTPENGWRLYTCGYP